MTDHGRNGRRLVFWLMPNMGGGGAERACLTYLERYDRSRFQIELVLCLAQGELLGLVPDDVKVHVLAKRSRFSGPIMVMRLRRLFRERKPAAVVSSIWYADMLQLLARRKRDEWCSIVTIHAVAEGLRPEPLGGVKIEIMRALYPRAHVALCVAGAVAADFEAAFARAGRPEVLVQENPVDVDEVVRRSKVSPAPARRAQHRLVALGRLHPTKGFDMLVRAFAELARELSVELYILGQGPEEDALRRQVGELGVAGRVHFLGFVDNPHPVVASADVLLAPSRFEAASLAIIEALALEVPVVVSNAPGASAELAGFGAHGRVVPVDDARALALATAELLRAPQLRRTLGRAGHHFVSRFRPEQVIPELEDRLTTWIENR